MEKYNQHLKRGYIPTYLRIRLETFMVIGMLLMNILGCANAVEIDKSDHYDGSRFFNPTMKEKYSPGFTDVFKMAREGRPEWPDSLENFAIPKIDETLSENQIRITFVNHATFLIQLPGINILTDPVWSEKVGPFSLVGAKRVRKPGIEFEKLPRIDIVLISHNHYDHLDVETLKNLNKTHSPRVLVPLGDKQLIESIGIHDVQEMDWWDSVEITPTLNVVFAPTQHSSRRGVFDLDKSLWGSFFITNNESKIYFGGDAAYSTHYSDIKKRLGSPDISLLGIGDYLPRWFMKNIHMNPEEAVQAHKDLGSKISIGMHHGTFQNSSVTYEQPATDLKRALIENELPNESFLIQLEGQSIVFQKDFGEQIKVYQDKLSSVTGPPGVTHD